MLGQRGISSRWRRVSHWPMWATITFSSGNIVITRSKRGKPSYSLGHGALPTWIRSTAPRASSSSYTGRIRGSSGWKRCTLMWNLKPLNP